MFSRKFVHSATLAVVFFLLSSPITYRLVDRLVGAVVSAVAPHSAETLKVAHAGCPTTYGLAVHAVVFGVVSYYLLHQN
uniref:Uncharacterized protein n=1 Tax=viral metagenome TaxID=1070528 RepID=A0A6C0CH71_9ZZZZ